MHTSIKRTKVAILLISLVAWATFQSTFGQSSKVIALHPHSASTQRKLLASSPEDEVCSGTSPVTEVSDDSEGHGGNFFHVARGDKGGLGSAGAILWVVLTLFVFLGIAIVSDDYFVPALEKIAEALDLSDDVAGATFLAAGSSAPEFLTSMVDTFLVANGDGFGIGTIVGSAIFNILVIVAVSCIPGGKRALHVDWWPLARDAFFYSASILALVLSIRDGRVEWYEAMIYLIVYILYLIVMKFNAPLGEFFKARIKIKNAAVRDSTQPADPDDSSDDAAEYSKRESLQQRPSFRRASFRKITTRAGSAGATPPTEITAVPVTVNDACGNNANNNSNNEESKEKSDNEKPVAKEGSITTPRTEGIDAIPLSGNELDEKDPNQPEPKNESVSTLDNNSTPSTTHASIQPVSNIHSIVGRRATLSTQNTDSSSASGGDDDEDPPLFDMPDDTVGRIMFFVSLPWLVLFRFTIPDAKRKMFAKWYPLSFAFCIMWIGILTIAMVRMVSYLGNIWQLPPYVMAIVVLAAGTSVPDALGSYNEAKRGHADAAVSNALGSNVFDILLGLGFPWFLYALIHQKPFCIPSDGLLIPTLILFAVLISFLLTLYICKFRLYMKVAYVFLFLYLMFVLYNVLSGVFDWKVDV